MHAEGRHSVTVIDTYDLVKVQVQQITGNDQWDVFDAPRTIGANDSKAGFWEPLDPSIVDPKDMVVERRITWRC